MSQSCYRHDAGFASNQYQVVVTGEQTYAKKVLYVLRTALTGIHLLRSGQLEADVFDLALQHGLSGVDERVVRKQQAEGAVLDSSERGHWLKALDAVMA